MQNEKTHVAIIGLGYVGLPLAAAFAKAGFSVTGLDINQDRIHELRGGIDRTGETESEELLSSSLSFTSDPLQLKRADFIIVAVPTPVHENKEPDLKPLEAASSMIGKNLKDGAVVVYESTVWPGLTEDYCVPLIEKYSRKKCGKHFFVGYSPERINPGDKEHTLRKMIKVVSGMNQDTLEKIAWLYGEICPAGVFRAATIRVAESAKVIENTQRDLNIALMNELAIIFRKLGISTKDVLETAATKWNFGRYTPGLVGGHCIPVDPYYLTTLAQKAGYEPKVILAGRAINDAMPEYITQLLEEDLPKNTSAKILVMGLTFKENVPDIRNSPAREVARILEKKGHKVFVYDPHLSVTEAKKYFNGELITMWPPDDIYDGIIITVAHKIFTNLKAESIKKLLTKKGVLVDVRGIFAKEPPKDVRYLTL